MEEPGLPISSYDFKRKTSFTIHASNLIPNLAEMTVTTNIYNRSQKKGEIGAEWDILEVPLLHCLWLAQLGVC